jgi:hypothetical protein
MMTKSTFQLMNEYALMRELKERERIVDETVINIPDYPENKNQTAHQINARIRKKDVKAKCVEYLGGKCKKCAQVFPNCVYDFHHRDKEQKDIEVSKILSRKWEELVTELDKCDLLCANCHRIYHDENGY